MSTVTVRIGQETRDLEAANESWINDQFHRRRQDGQNVCVRVIVDAGDVDIVLSTPGCATGGGGGRQATSAEFGHLRPVGQTSPQSARLYGWKSHRVLKQLRRMIG